MADITLADGREITFDLGTLTVKEYRALFDPKQTQADEDATMAKVTGLSADELQALPLLEMIICLLQILDMMMINLWIPILTRR